MEYTKSEAKAWAREKLVGQWTTMVTPFTKDDRLDEAGLKRNVEHVLSLGTKGLGFSWNMGEFWSLTREERLRLMDIVPELVNGRAMTAFQVTSTSLNEVIELSERARQRGFDFVIVAAPFIMTKTEEQVIDFVRRVSERTDIGIAFYNSPQFGITISAKGLSRIADIPSVIAIKEASFNTQISIDTHLLAGGKAVVSVPDEEIFLYEQYYGFHQQVMFANTSDWRFDTKSRHEYVKFIDAATTGNQDKARDLYEKVKPIKMVSRKWWSQTAAKTGGALPVQMVKCWGELMGMAGGAVRPPVIPFSEEDRTALKEDLARLGLVEQSVIE